MSSSEMGRLTKWKNPTQEPAKIGEILHDNMDYSTILTIPQKRPYFPGIENVALGVVYTLRFLFITKPTGYNKLMLISITFTLKNSHSCLTNCTFLCFHLFLARESPFFKAFNSCWNFGGKLKLPATKKKRLQAFKRQFPGEQ